MDPAGDAAPANTAGVGPLVTVIVATFNSRLTLARRVYRSATTPPTTPEVIG